jgi:hypothetical protein
VIGGQWPVLVRAAEVGGRSCCSERVRPFGLLEWTSNFQDKVKSGGRGRPPYTGHVGAEDRAFWELVCAGLEGLLHLAASDRWAVGSSGEGGWGGWMFLLQQVGSAFWAVGVDFPTSKT